MSARGKGKNKNRRKKKRVKGKATASRFDPPARENRLSSVFYGLKLYRNKCYNKNNPLYPRPQHPPLTYSSDIINLNPLILCAS